MAAGPLWPIGKAEPQTLAACRNWAGAGTRVRESCDARSLVIFALRAFLGAQCSTRQWFRFSGSFGAGVAVAGEGVLLVVPLALGEPCHCGLLTASGQATSSAGTSAISGQARVHEAPANSRGPPGIRLFLIIPTPAKHSLILIRHKLSSIFNMYNTLTLQHFLDTQADTSIFHTKQNDIILHYKTNS